VGFILQLQGLQGLHWSTSVSQIIAVFLMTAVRGWVRRGSSPPVAKRVLDGCEMDWLALEVVTDEVTRYFSGTQDDWEPYRRLQNWTVTASLNNLAHSGDLRNATVTGKGQTAGGQPDWDTKVQQRVLRHRQRLGQLTNWVGPASKPAISVADAIEAIMNTLIPRTGAEFSWYLQVEMEMEMSKSQNETESRNGTIKFTVRNMEQDGWAIDSTEIEAALSLWIYSNKRRGLEREPYMGENSDTTIEGTLKGGGLKGGWLDYEKWKTQSIRVLGPNTEHLNKDLKRWIGNIDFDKSINDAYLVAGFIGLRSRVPVRSTFIIVVPRSVYLITYS